MANENLKPVKSITVARRLEKISRGNKLDHQQLQKLTYYSHGWSMVMLGFALTMDEIQARELGPIYPEMADMLKIDIDEALNGKSKEELHPRQMHLINKVYESYGHYSGHRLSKSTHEADPLNPWHHVRNVRGLKNGVIENSLIENYFRLRLAPRHLQDIA